MSDYSEVIFCASLPHFSKIFVLREFQFFLCFHFFLRDNRSGQKSKRFKFLQCMNLFDIFMRIEIIHVRTYVPVLVYMTIPFFSRIICTVLEYCTFLLIFKSEKQ